jgi:transcriptional regulator with XRE-family HTH domain
LEVVTNVSETASVVRDETAEWQKLGERLRDAREYLGLSQGEVAQALDVPRPSVSAMEAGKRKVSSMELGRLARLYRRPYEYFLGEKSDEDVSLDETGKALYRATRELSEEDREQVLRFAEFLSRSGPAPRHRRNE